MHFSRNTFFLPFFKSLTVVVFPFNCLPLHFPMCLSKLYCQVTAKLPSLRGHTVTFKNKYTDLDLLSNECFIFIDPLFPVTDIITLMSSIHFYCRTIYD